MAHGRFIGIFALSLQITLCTPTLVQAADDEYISYDSIVNQLSGSQQGYLDSKDPFSQVQIHAGVGVINTISDITAEDGQSINSIQQGFQATLGIDLFSPFWLAEGSVRSFQTAKDSQAEVDLKEFDLKVMHRRPLTSFLGLRFGLGMSARYMRLKQMIESGGKIQEQSNDYTTPASLVFTGIDAWLGKNVSLGFDISYRSALISETVDKEAYDFSLRFDTHF